MSATTWRKGISSAFESSGDEWATVISSTLTYEDLDQEFDDGYGGSEGCPFTLWTEKYVYFPVVYDGSEWVGWVPRNPCDIKTSHIGGE